MAARYRCSWATIAVRSTLRTCRPSTRTSVTLPKGNVQKSSGRDGQGKTHPPWPLRPSCCREVMGVGKEGEREDR